MSDAIRVRGAREHNLHGVDVDVPRDALVMFTGVSGSGKSSLAFATIYAEAQRRYFESIAPYARRLIAQAGAPKVELIDGLPPAVALQQRRSAPTSRSTVGTLTAASNSLRMLMSRTGTYPEGAERLDSDAFSPNTAAGACPACNGLGEVHDVTEASLVPDPALTIREKAIAAWPGAWQGKNYRDILGVLGYPLDVPWRELPQDDRDWILFTDEQPVVTVHAEREAHRIQRPYQGTYMSARRYVLTTLARTQSKALRERALRHVVTRSCDACGGARVRPEALAVTFCGANVGELAALPLTQLMQFVEPTVRTGDGAAAVLVRDLVHKLEPVVRLGLGYLTLDRTATTLSAGEHQRIRLAAQLRSGLFGVAYVLDEPSAGLHPADADAMMDVLVSLRDAGNSLLVVEHDMSLVRRADWIVDVGPGAGEHGGRVLYSGPVAGIEAVAESVTRSFLSVDNDVNDTMEFEPGKWIELSGVTRHNIAGLDVRIPRSALTVVTGPSGSGKTTLVGGVLAERAAAGGIVGVDRVVSVDQSPIGRTPRSNLATYTGLFDAVRKAFAATDDARARGFGAGRFSFNVDGGRCETCQGEGFVAVELLFLPGTYGVCPTCNGSRYNDATLEVRWNGYSIADVLALSVDDAGAALTDVRGAARVLAVLHEIGLGYLRLGQPATELSGGEAQRIKLASELARTARGHTLYLLDEPTSGLHPADVRLLMHQLRSLVSNGATVVAVEHDMHVAAAADWVIDLGPGGGPNGGRIVAEGPPTAVAASTQSRTAPYLRHAFRPS